MHNMHIPDIMKLDSYLKQYCISSGQFAAKVGVNCSTIYRIRTGRTFPHKKTIQAIWQATGGQVGPNDLLGISIGGNDPGCGMPHKHEREKSL